MSRNRKIKRFPEYALRYKVLAAQWQWHDQEVKSAFCKPVGQKIGEVFANVKAQVWVILVKLGQESGQQMAAN
jgi:hypothetical protein